MCIRDRHEGAAHGGHAGGVADGLAGHLLVALLVIADVVDIVGLVLAVLLAGKDAALSLIHIYLAIASGEFTLSSGDDAIHSDAAITILDGTYTIPVCYEGIEGCSITIWDGTFSITSVSYTHLNHF